MYAIYDTVLLKYVGAVHAKKADAEESAKKLGESKRFKVREV